MMMMTTTTTDRDDPTAQQQQRAATSSAAAVPDACQVVVAARGKHHHIAFCLLLRGGHQAAGPTEEAAAAAAAAFLLSTCCSTSAVFFQMVARAASCLLCTAAPAPFGPTSTSPPLSRVDRMGSARNSAQSSADMAKYCRQRTSPRAAEGSSVPHEVATKPASVEQQMRRAGGGTSPFQLRVCSFTILRRQRVLLRCVKAVALQPSARLAPRARR